MSETVRLFVGADGTNADLEAQCVLEYTARQHCSWPLEIIWMTQAASGPWSGWASSARGATPFTSFRWSPPAVCGYKGKAISCDSDFVYCGDLAEIWSQPIPNVALVRNPVGKLSTSFIVFDCAKAKGHVPGLDELKAMPDAHGSLLKYFRAHPELLSATSGNWDCPDLAGYQLGDPRVKAIHYTRIEHWLHLKHAIPRLAKEGRTHWYKGDVFAHPRPELQALFDRLLVEAHESGYIVDKYRVEPFDKATRRDFKYKHHVGTKALS